MNRNANTLLDFPCEFPIKALGHSSNDFNFQVMEIVRKHVIDIAEGAIKERQSKKGKYTSVTITIRATSQKQIDSIYQELSNCPCVLMVL